MSLQKKWELSIHHDHQSKTFFIKRIEGRNTYVLVSREKGHDGWWVSKIWAKNNCKTLNRTRNTGGSRKWTYLLSTRSRKRSDEHICYRISQWRNWGREGVTDGRKFRGFLRWRRWPLQMETRRENCWIRVSHWWASVISAWRMHNTASSVWWIVALYRSFGKHWFFDCVRG